MKNRLDMTEPWYYSKNSKSYSKDGTSVSFAARGKKA
jgi:hypothetical protein